MPLLQADLRCLDAHVHLGNLDFDRRPDKAARHYRVTQDIGELSLGPSFRDALLWGHINNRPYLRALHGLALCLWRLNQRPEAIAILERMLWLNPPDNQGVRFLLPDIQAGISWEDSGDNHGNQATDAARSAS
jgi:tetratricopeptide (TPR) repeat protein